jgi:hypothetical protein
LIEDNLEASARQLVERTDFGQSGHRLYSILVDVRLPVPWG